MHWVFLVGIAVNAQYLLQPCVDLKMGARIGWFLKLLRFKNQFVTLRSFLLL
jgi:hypothetical protein